MNNLFNTTAEKGSVRNIILIFIAVLLVGGSFAFAEYRNTKAQNTYTASENVSVDTKNITVENLDSDGDGLKDWEEILQGSDPKDQKSKGGIVKSPVVEKDLTVRKEALTSTDILSRDFFARYMELRQMGISNDKQSQQDAINQSLNKVMALSQPKKYSVNDITTLSNTDKETVRDYVNKMGTIFSTYNINSRSEAVIAKEAMDKANPKILDDIDPIISSYKKILGAIMKVSAPSTMTQMHLDLVNSVSGAIFIAELFKKSANDPVSGLQAAGSYIKYAGDFNTAYNSIRSYLTFLGVTYTAEEGGTFFTRPKS